MNIVIALCMGFLLDLLIGDPQRLPHTVQAIGWLIVKLESILRKAFPKTGAGERAAGTAMVFFVCLVSFGLPALLLFLAARLHPCLPLLLECIMSWQVLAIKSLRSAAMKVYGHLIKGDLNGARRAVAMVVGRDTDNLNAEGVAQATVETVAENTSDGIVAPMFFFALGGGPMALLYKAINTMDSMVGYQNAKYMHFGRSAALLDDAANYLPARFSGLLIVAASFFARMDVANAWRILWRDRRKHKSPNSAWPEAACAGALDIQLGGTSQYGGQPVAKPTIGDKSRQIEPEDIVAAVRLEYTAAVICLMLCLLIRLGILALMRGLGI